MTFGMTGDDPILDGYDSPDEFDLDDSVYICTAEQVGHCDITPPARYIHDCTRDDQHPGAHECACGHTWTEPDD